MTKKTDSALTCTENACTPASGALPDGERTPGSSDIVQVDVVSDVICPWCYVGKQNLQRAIDLLGSELTVRVRWLPYELNPDMPASGMDRKEYRSVKFGSWEKSRELDAQVAAAGAAVGLDFHHERMERTPNTLDAHRLIWLGRQHGLQDKTVDAVFRAYFVEGRDMNDRATLISIAKSVGIPSDVASEFFSRDAGRAEVLREETDAKRLGGHGVPTFVVNGTPLFSGAQRPEVMAAAIRHAAREVEARPASREMQP